MVSDLPVSLSISIFCRTASAENGVSLLRVLGVEDDDEHPITLIGEHLIFTESGDETELSDAASICKVGCKSTF